jgi:hypothetical protein
MNIQMVDLNSEEQKPANIYGENLVTIHLDPHLCVKLDLTQDLHNCKAKTCF